MWCLRSYHLLWWKSGSGLRLLNEIAGKLLIYRKFHWLRNITTDLLRQRQLPDSKTVCSDCCLCYYERTHTLSLQSKPITVCCLTSYWKLQLIETQTSSALVSIYNFADSIHCAQLFWKGSSCGCWKFTIRLQTYLLRIRSSKNKRSHKS